MWGYRCRGRRGGDSWDEGHPSDPLGWVHVGGSEPPPTGRGYRDTNQSGGDNPEVGSWPGVFHVPLEPRR